MPAKTSTTFDQDAKIAAMVFADIYPHYLAKVEKKGRTQAELNAVLCWLLGFSPDQLQAALDERLIFKDLFDRAALPRGAERITGVICGYRVEALKGLTRNARRMDKVVDELAKGKTVEVVTRSP